MYIIFKTILVLDSEVLFEKIGSLIVCCFVTKLSKEEIIIDVMD